MINKCPECGFQPLKDKVVCPNCGIEIKENIAEKIKKDKETIVHSTETTKNDNIRWSDYEDVSLGEMMEQLGSEESSQNQAVPDSSDSDGEKNTQKETEENILAAYIRAHKEDASAETSKRPSETKSSASNQEESTQDSKQEAQDSIEIKSEAQEKLIPRAEEKASGTEGKSNTGQAKEELLTDKENTQQPVSAAANQETTLPKDDEKEAAVVSDAVVDDQQTKEVKAVNTVNESKSTEETQPNPDELVTEEKRSKDKTGRRKPLLILGAVAVIGFGSWGVVAHQQQEAKQAQLAETKNELAAISTELDSFYLDEDKQFLVSDKSLEDLQEVTAKLDAYKEETSYSELAQKAASIKEKLTTLTTLNSFFEAPIIVGDELKAVHLKDGNPVTMAKLTGTDAFDQLVNQAIANGQAEYTQIEEAQNAVKATVALLKGNELSDSVTRSGYEEIMNKITALPDSSIKTALTQEMKPIEEALSAREAVLAKEAAEQQAKAQAAAEQAAQEAAAASQASAGTTQAASQGTTSEETYLLSPSTPTNTNNQPIIPARQSDLDDVNNAGWTWAEGVQEKIIATAIARGYVVAGGYTFERVRIENGEGYYNFYATNNQSSLLSGINASAFPMYLFTVNAKTGYFRGNGNDHTVR